MRAFLVRWLIHGISLWVASVIVPGVTFPGDPPSVGQVVVVALLFGAVNALVKPLVALASCGLYVLTLGLFHFVVNALMLWLTAWLAGPWFDVAGFWSAFGGALVTTVIGTVLTWWLDPQPPHGGDGDGDGTYVVIEGR